VVLELTEDAAAAVVVEMLLGVGAGLDGDATGETLRDVDAGTRADSVNADSKDDAVAGGSTSSLVPKEEKAGSDIK
jgi:hypothetical protein